ncbi:hypothetical protein KIN20_009974 [Parelaphostrongylus tenuis]|uniref:Uncharacterized protein n=1 Tax=Parelaphostrongylus tenuis TaxID=148309 RepID=A0AAD5QK06_PARTN|nr:hypothetical protein KIN20_009974 [Parelaphostrongylus tenuis]
MENSLSDIRNERGQICRFTNPPLEIQHAISLMRIEQHLVYAKGTVAPEEPSTSSHQHTGSVRHSLLVGVERS